jgi:hypothetical protein
MNFWNFMGKNALDWGNGTKTGTALIETALTRESL